MSVALSTFRCATLNVCGGLAHKYHHLTMWMIDQRINVLAITEAGPPPTSPPHFTLWAPFNHDELGPIAQRGVALMFAPWQAGN